MALSPGPYQIRFSAVGLWEVFDKDDKFLAKFWREEDARGFLELPNLLRSCEGLLAEMSAVNINTAIYVIAQVKGSE